MNQQTIASADATPAVRLPTTTLWTSASAVAALGAWVLFDARPGVNWLLWTAAAVAGLQLAAQRNDSVRAGNSFLRFAPICIAGAATVNASEQLFVLIALSIIFYLAVQMLVTTRESTRAITMRLVAFAPPVALGKAALHATRRAVEATQLIRSTRARAWVRGLVISVPVLVVFSLLLANADPVFAAMRDAIDQRLVQWDQAPRLIFFAVLLVIVLGAYSYAQGDEPTPHTATIGAPARWFGSTERLMLFSGVAALLWLFVALQLSYLFGNQPQLPNSGLTFAEHARRGFGELSVVASASALLIIVSQRYGIDGGHPRVLRILTFAVMEAVLLVLVSAFRRVLLYEAAYGFTTDRLYAQVYMVAVAIGLVLLAIEVIGEFDLDRLFRRSVAAATVLFAGLLYWNHEGWIARKNMDRLATNGQLDVAYLVNHLSPRAIPTIVQRLPSVPEPMRSELLGALGERHSKLVDGGPRRWMEWNVADTRAREAFQLLPPTP